MLTIMIRTNAHEEKTEKENDNIVAVLEWWDYGTSVLESDCKL